MTANKGARVKVSRDGPYIVSGSIPLIREIEVRGADGLPREWKKVADYPEKETYSLCRCGETKGAPFCDGSHVAARFDGTETAVRRKNPEKPKLVKGPGVDLDGNAAPCARAQFCQRSGGIGKLVAGSDDVGKRAMAIEIAGQCPTGRLVTYEKDGRSIEPVFEKVISVAEDPGRKLSGPLWVKGGITIEGADGEPYLVANRVALCRCGRSKRMPLCDGSHVEARFDRTGDLR